jgi:hypothetical protein
MIPLNLMTLAMVGSVACVALMAWMFINAVTVNCDDDDDDDFVGENMEHEHD